MSKIRYINLPVDFLERRSFRKISTEWPRSAEWFWRCLRIAREALNAGRLETGREPVEDFDLSSLHAIPTEWTAAAIDAGLLLQEEDGCLAIPSWSDFFYDPEYDKESKKSLFDFPEWLTFLDSWHGKFGDAAVSCSELADLAASSGIRILQKIEDRNKRSHRLGSILSSGDPSRGSYSVKLTGKNNRVNHYMIHRTDADHDISHHTQTYHDIPRHITSYSDISQLNQPKLNQPKLNQPCNHVSVSPGGAPLVEGEVDEAFRFDSQLCRCRTRLQAFDEAISAETERKLQAFVKRGSRPLRSLIEAYNELEPVVAADQPLPPSQRKIREPHALLIKKANEYHDLRLRKIADGKLGQYD